MRARLARLLGRSAPPAVALGDAQAIARLQRDGPAPLSPGDASIDGPLRVAVVVPHFRGGSGGHTTIAHLVRALEARGHRCAIWVHDPDKRSAGAAAFRELFGPFAAAVHDGTEGFAGADVALATGWQTVAPVLMLERCAARAYLVQDHEPDFYPASAEREWATASYGHGLHCITAGTWLAEVVAGYGATATPFDLGIDRTVYRLLGLERAPARALFYARASTPRRAVPIGLAALAELKRRRPDVEVALFGDHHPIAAPFDHEHLGVLGGDALARAYATATVGMVLSLTNHSLVAQEMLACGLPAVELDTPSTRAAFGPSPPVELAPAEPAALADALQRLLDDPALRAERAAGGERYCAGRTWAAAAEQVEAGLRAALSAARAAAR